MTASVVPWCRNASDADIHAVSAASANLVHKLVVPITKVPFYYRTLRYGEKGRGS